MRGDRAAESARLHRGREGARRGGSRARAGREAPTRRTGGAGPRSATPRARRASSSERQSSREQPDQPECRERAEHEPRRADAASARGRRRDRSGRRVAKSSDGGQADREHAQSGRAAASSSEPSLIRDEQELGVDLARGLPVEGDGERRRGARRSRAAAVRTPERPAAGPRRAGTARARARARRPPRPSRSMSTSDRAEQRPRASLRDRVDGGTRRGHGAMRHRFDRHRSTALEHRRLGARPSASSELACVVGHATSARAVVEQLGEQGDELRPGAGVLPEGRLVEHEHARARSRARSRPRAGAARRPRA